MSLSWWGGKQSAANESATPEPVKRCGNVGGGPPSTVGNEALPSKKKQKQTNNNKS